MFGISTGMILNDVIVLVIVLFYDVPVKRFFQWVRGKTRSSNTKNTGK